MITISQTKIPFMSGVSEAIRLLIFAHEAKKFLQRNWIWILIILGILSILIYKMREYNRIQDEKIKGMLKKKDGVTKTKNDLSATQQQKNTLNDIEDFAGLLNLIQKK